MKILGILGSVALVVLCIGLRALPRINKINSSISHTTGTYNGGSSYGYSSKSNKSDEPTSDSPENQMRFWKNRFYSLSEMGLYSPDLKNAKSQALYWMEKHYDELQEKIDNSDSYSEIENYKSQQEELEELAQKINDTYNEILSSRNNSYDQDDSYSYNDNDYSYDDDDYDYGYDDEDDYSYDDEDEDY